MRGVDDVEDSKRHENAQAHRKRIGLQHVAEGIDEVASATGPRRHSAEANVGTSAAEMMRKLANH